MNLEEFRKKRKARLENLQEALSNMPELVDDKAHGEVGAVEMDAIKSSKERDEKVKDSFKDKNKEVKEFVKKQDKDRKVDKEEESENRLMLDESLFLEDYDDADELRDVIVDWLKAELDVSSLAPDMAESAVVEFYEDEDAADQLNEVDEDDIQEILDEAIEKIADLYTYRIDESLKEESEPGRMERLKKEASSEVVVADNKDKKAVKVEKPDAKLDE